MSGYDWEITPEGIGIWVDKEYLSKAKEILRSDFPDYTDLVGWDTSLTQEDIMSRMAEHGTWWAIEFEGRPYEDIDEDFTCELGAYVSWFSESLAPGLDGPGYAAGLAFGYPARPDAHWATDEVVDFAIAYACERDGDGNMLDGEELERKLFDVLYDIWTSN